MSPAVRWVVAALVALLVVGLIGWARGDEHHRGDKIGAGGKTSTSQGPG